MDTHPKAPENIRMVDMTFFGQSAPDIRRKLRKLGGAFGMNPQLVDVNFKVLKKQGTTIEARECKMECNFSGSSIGFPEGE